MKKQILIFLILFINVLFCQDEYKVSSDYSKEEERYKMYQFSYKETKVYSAPDIESKIFKILKPGEYYQMLATVHKVKLDGKLFEKLKFPDGSHGFISYEDSCLYRKYKLDDLKKNNEDLLGHIQFWKKYYGIYENGEGRNTMNLLLKAECGDGSLRTKFLVTGSHGKFEEYDDFKKLGENLFELTAEYTYSGDKPGPPDVLQIQALGDDKLLFKVVKYGRMAKMKKVHEKIFTRVNEDEHPFQDADF